MIKPKWDRDGKGNTGAHGLTALQWLLNRTAMEKDGTFDAKEGPACCYGHKACSTAKSIGGPCRKEMRAIEAGKAFKRPARVSTDA